MSVTYIGNEICVEKPFGEQLIECKESGVLIKEKCKCCGCVLYLCKKHGGQCSPEKCYIDRLRRIIIENHDEMIKIKKGE